MTPISKNIIKGIRSLEQRKFRRSEGLFVAEGNKLVADCLGLRSGAVDATSAPPMRCRRLVATADWLTRYGAAVEASLPSGYPRPEWHEVSPAEMERISLQTSPQEVLGVFEMPRHHLSPTDLQGRLTLMLDDVQDPGNVGTIIRLCDWYGIRDILASTATADCFAPKVVQASMGAVARVRVHYINLPEWLDRLSAPAEGGTPLPVFGTFLDGTDIYQTTLAPTGIIVMGNEGRGISDAVARYVTQRLFLPSYPRGAATSESLNVGIATAITVAEFRRRQQQG